MLVQSVARIDDWHIQMLRHDMGRSGVRVADYNNIRSHGAERVAGIEKRFTLFNARSGGLNEYRMCAQRFRRDFKRASRTGRGLVKKKHDALAFKQGTRLIQIHLPGSFYDFEDL